MVFVRDFVMNGEYAIIKNFLLKTLYLQGSEKKIDRFKLGKDVMPTSFIVIHYPVKKIDSLEADFGGRAIGRVTPVDSGFWWIILLHAYTKATGNATLAESQGHLNVKREYISFSLSVFLKESTHSQPCYMQMDVP